MNQLWLRQITAVARLEVVKNLFSLRAAPLYLLAAMPIFVVGLLYVSMAFGEGPSELETPGGTALFFAYLYQFILRFVVYAGCVWIFMNLFRGEVLDRSLHYYFLSPIRREVLVVGKFLSGWLTAVLLFVGSTLVTMFLLYASSMRSPELGHLISYAGVTVLACVGYGAVFLVIGLFFRNPIIPAVIFFLWEGANWLLPGLLKKISVIFYLQSMFPVPVSDGPFAVLADPVSAWIATPGLILFSAIVMTIAGLRIRRMEIAYAND
jgi:ABC-type transport system involved in multi-copper enzyme maturation permease subunit